MRPMSTRASATAHVNEQGPIEVVPADIPRFDHDPVTLAPKGVLIEVVATNFIPRSNSFSAWTPTGLSISFSTDFPISSTEGVWLITADGSSSSKPFRRNLAINPIQRTVSVYLRRGTNSFAQFYFGGDLTNFANFDI